MAVSDGRMVITMDKDFGELIYNSGMNPSGVLLLRLEVADSEKKVRIVKKILEEHQDKLHSKFCVFQFEALRIRK